MKSYPDGGLCLVELKTGNMGMSKLGRTRKELVYYTRMLRALGYDEVTHFLYITPDYEIPEDLMINYFLKVTRGERQCGWGLNVALLC
jgi:hypothetical protein